MQVSFNSELRPRGSVAMQVERNVGVLTDRHPASPVWWHVRNWIRYRHRELPATAAYRLLGKVCGLVRMESQLSLKHFRQGQLLVDYGVVSRRVVTTVGVGYIVDAFQNSVELENMKYHGFGTGTTGAAVGDSDIETEMTTQYASDNTRPTGTTSEGASANIYQTVATFSPDSGGTIAITEHGVLSSATVGSGVLIDRHTFSAVNVVASSDSLQATYELTLSAGG